MNRLRLHKTMAAKAALGTVMLAWAVMLTSCREDREQALVDLERRHITAEPAALQMAVRQKDTDVIGFLGRAGVKAALPEPGQPTVLHLAASQGDWPMVLQLMESCDAAIINHPGPQQAVILEQAVQAGKWDVARRLVMAGARPESAACGVDALVRATAAEPELMDLVLAKLPEGHAALAPALLRAVQAGEKDRVQRLLDYKAPPGAAQHRDKGTAMVLPFNQTIGSLQPVVEGTPLELACQAGHRDIAAALLKAGAVTADSPRALPAAVQRKDEAMARLLLEAGASPNTPAEAALPEATPLQAAMAGGEKALLALMLDHGAAPGTCLEYALSQGDAALLEMLHERGVPLDQPGADGDPPLVRAVVAGQEDIVRKLLAWGGAPDTPGALGQSAYHMAVIHRKSAIVDLLLAGGAKPDAPFVKPAPAGLLPLFESDYFTKWYQRDTNLTPLMLAAARGDVAQVRQLLKAGAKRGTTTKEWHRYPIVFACDNAHIGAAQALLGCNPEEETKKRHAVISLSRQRVTLFENDQPVRTSKVSTGKKSTPTLPGKYVITDKQVDWVSSIYKVSMPFFMRLSCKEIGMHAGVVPGYPASHGCIRMPRNDVQAFFKLLKIGDPVTIEY